MYNIPPGRAELAAQGPLCVAAAKGRRLGLATSCLAAAGRCLLAALYHGLYRPLMWPRRLYNRCKADADVALHVCVAIDRWCGGVCLVLYIAAVTSLLYIQSLVGDHKLMLGDRPGNM